MKDNLEQVYRQHRRGLYALAVSITGCSQKAEDAVHAAFERLCRRKPVGTDQLTTYVYTCVRNSAIDLIRKDQRHDRLAVDLFDGSASSAENSTDQLVLTAERDHILRQTIGELCPDDREIVLMKAFSQLTFDEISTITDRPAATVATRYRRALETLQHRLKAKL